MYRAFLRFFHATSKPLKTSANCMKTFGMLYITLQGMSFSIRLCAIAQEKVILNLVSSEVVVIDDFGAKMNLIDLKWSFVVDIDIRHQNDYQILSFLDFHVYASSILSLASCGACITCCNKNGSIRFSLGTTLTPYLMGTLSRLPDSAIGAYT